MAYDGAMGCASSSSTAAHTNSAGIQEHACITVVLCVLGTAEGGVFFTYMGEEGQQELRPREQTIGDFKDFITKFYPANQQQTFIYRLDGLLSNKAVCSHWCHTQQSFVMSQLAAVVQES